VCDVHLHQTDRTRKTGSWLSRRAWLPTNASTAQLWIPANGRKASKLVGVNVYDVHNEHLVVVLFVLLDLSVVTFRFVFRRSDDSSNRVCPFRFVGMNHYLRQFNSITMSRQKFIILLHPWQTLSDLLFGQLSSMFQTSIRLGKPQSALLLGQRSSMFRTSIWPKPLIVDVEYRVLRFLYFIH
jgi:hypothetical protein